jgi:alpha-amylase
LQSVGYDVYDLYDLGEYDQKGSVRTKYGTKEELLKLVRAAKECDIVIYLDTVLNHKFGADDRERFKVKEVENDDRTKPIGGIYDIEVGIFQTLPSDHLTSAVGLDQVYLRPKEQ